MPCMFLSHLVRDHAQAFVLLGALGAYAAYYYAKVVQMPQIFSKDGKFLRFIQRHCTVLREPFKPTVWGFTPHFQTIGPILMKYKPINCRSEKLAMPDRGEVILDWVDPHGDKQNVDGSTPLVLILPGLTGSSKSYYATTMIRAITERGYRCVVFNNRGFGGAEIKTSKIFGAANTDDLEFVIDHIHSLTPDAPIIAVGFSIGGTILFNYLAKVGANTPVVAAMTVSVIWNIMESVASMDKPVNSFLFKLFIAKELTRVLANNAEMFEGRVDIDHVIQAKTIKQFDERFTSKMFGYETVEHYYNDATIHNKLHHIKIPTLCLNAGDDAFAPSETIPTTDAREQSNVVLVVTSRGGHVGFNDGFLPRGNGYMIRLIEQFVDGFFKYGLKEVGSCAE